MLDTVKTLIQKNKQLYHVCKRIKDCISKPIFTFDTRCNLQKTDKKKYCVIAINNDNPFGTCELWIHIALRAIIAEADGYIPYVDMQNYKQTFWIGLRADKSTNAWDIFFKQYENNIALDEVYKTDYVSFVDAFSYGAYDPILFMTEDTWKIFHDMYLKLAPKEEVFEEAYSYKLPDKTLGIIIRRGMESGMKLKIELYTNWWGHHIRGSLSGYEKWIRENLEKLGFRYFFLATDDRETLEYFKQSFGDTCLYYERKLSHNFENGEPIDVSDPRFFSEFKKDEDRWLVNEKAYIAETIILSKCDAVLHNSIGQNVMAQIMRDTYQKPISNSVFLEMY